MLSKKIIHNFVVNTSVISLLSNYTYLNNEVYKRTYQSIYPT